MHQDSPPKDGSVRILSPQSVGDPPAIFGWVGWRKSIHEFDFPLPKPQLLEYPHLADRYGSFSVFSRGHPESRLWRDEGSSERAEGECPLPEKAPVPSHFRRFSSKRGSKMKLTRFNQLMEHDKLVDGKWRFNDRHELEYWEKNGAKKARFKAALVDAESNALVVALSAEEKEEKMVTRTARLTGTWHLNETNQIVFDIEKRGGLKDRLTFQGAWRLNDSHEIVYTYDQSRLKRRTKEVQTLTFKGHWDLTEGNRLTYLLEGDTESAFRIRGTFQTKSILAKEGEIRYQFGTEAEGNERLETVRLFGKWKLSRDLGLSFEIEYRDGRKHAMVFGAELSLGSGQSIHARLLNKEDDPLGVELIFTQEFMEGEGGLFLGLRKTLEESALHAGIKMPW
ncbi:MAG: hypothetical protein A3G87_00375 [Omnitrophica bacterium RIFCSPLOWO2_12_FULL_50_11]|nr:MAG: hypothetical protein A3G87_00375 [Omnitrophica bacterium RIFCSPLOWO2_12_FULL_50_11]